MKWQEGYKEKLRSAEEVAGMVKSGETVVFGMMSEPVALGNALARRKDKLENVTIIQSIVTQPFDWFNRDAMKAFNLITSFVGPPGRQAAAEKRVQYRVGGRPRATLPQKLPPELCPNDWFFIPISPPDEHGFCSFGTMLWSSRSSVRRSKKVAGEVCERMIRTGGDNWIHISEIDYLVEGTTPPAQWVTARQVTEKDAQCIEAISNLVATLVNDGDTIQIGTGTMVSQITPALEEKHDLGMHAELTPPGVVDLVKKGVITGRRKNINPGKIVATCFVLEEKDFEYVENNPVWELRDAEYTNNPNIIGTHDNMVAINQAMIMDLTGQCSAESVGPQMISGAGGQTSFVIGCSLSNGGRNITVIQSTNRKGESNIMPSLPEGTVVTAQRQFVEYVVSEYGIANLIGKTERQRAEELIAIAHPDHRAELRKQARKLWGP